MEEEKKVPTEILKDIIRKIQNSEGGLSREELVEDSEYEEILINKGLNYLLEKTYIREIQSNGELKFFVRPRENATPSMDKLELTGEEKLIYSLIKEAGEKGISSNDLNKRSKSHSGKPNSALICKTLEKRDLIKCINEKEANKTKKMWFLRDTTPIEKSKETVLKEKPEDLERLCNKILNMMYEKDESLSAEDILEGLMKKGENISEQILEFVLNSLIYSDKIEEIKKGSSKMRKYKTCNWDFIDPKFMRSPCSTCPVINECKPGFTISPENCIYFEKW